MVFDILSKVKSWLGWAVALIEGILATTGNFPVF